MKYSIKIKLRHSNKPQLVYHAIFVRVAFAGKYVDLYPGASTKIDNWDMKKEKLKTAIPKSENATEINKKITSTIEFVENYFVECDYLKLTPSSRDLSDKYSFSIKKTKEVSTTTFRDVYENYIQDMLVQRNWTKNTYAQEVRVKDRLTQCLPEVSFSTLTTSNLNIFVSSLLLKMNNEKMKDYLKKLKAFGRWAMAHGYPVSLDMASYEVTNFRTSNKDVRFLETEEINTLYKLDLTAKPNLEQTRDFFIFQCLTSLRFSDLKALKVTNFRLEEGVYYLTLMTQKTKKKITDLPLPEIAAKIFEKYRKNNYPNGAAFPILSNAGYNKSLKLLGELAEIEGEWNDVHFAGNQKVEITVQRKELTSHVARRTFVSYALNHNVPVEVVALATSHSSVKEMMPYLNLTQRGMQGMKDVIDTMIDV